MSDVVLIHGFTGGPSSFEALIAHWPEPRPRIHCPAVLGHSGADGPDAASFEAELERLDEWIRQRASRSARVHLCGYSLGGRLALGLLARHPRRFASGLLVGAHPGLALLSARVDRRKSDLRWIELLEREGTEAFARAWEAQALFHSQATLDPALLERQRALRRSHPAAGLAQSLRVLGLAEMPDMRRHLSSLGPHVELVVGSQDEKFVALAREMVALAANLRLTCIPGAGHNILLEAPGPLACLLRGALGSAA